MSTCIMQGEIMNNKLNTFLFIYIYIFFFHVISGVGWGIYNGSTDAVSQYQTDL